MTEPPALLPPTRGTVTQPSLAPIRSPTYLRFLGAWTVTQAGVWVYYTAMTWTVLQNAGTAAAIAILPLVYVVPVPIAIVASGFLTDRRGPRFTLALSELGLGAALLLGAGLAVAGALSFGPTLLVGALVGTSVGLCWPASSQRRRTGSG